VLFRSHDAARGAEAGGLEGGVLAGLADFEVQRGGAVYHGAAPAGEPGRDPGGGFGGEAGGPGLWGGAPMGGGEGAGGGGAGRPRGDPALWRGPALEGGEGRKGLGEKFESFVK